MVKQGLAITLMALQVWQPVLAGVVATHPQVTQGSAANGVPVVNIATPGQSGISHNTYTRFDVDRQGLILNNSGQPVNTQLGGFIPGNANLPGGGARLILNEVSGQLPSQLKGYMEIAGQKAELVIANPAGITCNGCGFINTSRGTLTTGKPLFGGDGSLSGFRVEEGALAIEGLGLNASNTDRVQLYSRALSLNAELHGRDLDVVTGRFEIDNRNGNITPLASDGTAPAAFAVDSSSLGGMYANRIRLVGTEAGVGMRLAAPVAALNGNLEITSNGDVRMVRASATQRVDISAQGNVGIDSDTLTGRDGISSGIATTLHAGGAVDLASGADLTGAAISITAASVTAASDTGIAARGALSLQAAQQHLGGNVASQQTVTLSGDTIANHGQIAANTGFTVTASTLDNTGHISSVGGKGRLDVTGQLLNTNGVIEHGGALAITTASMDNADGHIAANGMLSVTATEAGIDNSRGLLQGNAGVVITSPGLLNQAGEVAGNADIRLVLANGALDNRQGLIETRGTIDLQSGGVLQNADGRIHAGDDLDFALARFDRAAAGGDFVAGDHWQINADGDIVFNGDVVTLPGALTLDSRTGAITVDSRIEAGGPASLVAGSIRIGQQGFIATQDTLAATTTNLDNQGLLYGKTAVDLTVQGTFNNGAEHYKTDPALYRNAVVLSEGNINLTALNGKRMLAINNYGGHIESLRGDVTLKADQITNINIGWAPRNPYQSVSTTYSTSLAAWNAYNRGYAGEDVRVYQFHFTTTHHDVQRQGNRGQIVAARDITIEADTVENDRSSISAAANLWLDADRVTNTATHLRDRISKQTNYRYWDCYYNKVGKKKCGRTHQGSLGTSTYWGPEEADKTIKAVIEGGIDVVLNADTILNGEPVIRGSTSDIEGGQIPDVPGQAPQQAPPAGAINLGIVDPTSFPGFGLPGNGLFRRTAPGHPYLIETDPALNTYQGFLGSGYLLEHLEWSPQITQRRLGDSYYEVMLVRDALIASLGSRFVHPSITDERLQYEYLMENAIAASESLHLSAGVALSREQIDALQQDIVWLEERVIAGERVLVPVVYLAHGSTRVLSDGAVIGGGHVSLSGSTVRNAGLIRSRDNLSINATQNINNLGGTMDAGGDLLLESGGDILNESGRLAGNNVTLQAKGDITHRTWTERERFGTADNGNWNTLIGDTAAVEARGTQVQIAGGNIQVVGGQLTGNSVALGAGGSILLDTVQVEQGYQFSGSDWEKSEQQVRHLQTQVLAARDLSLTAGADITAIAATLKAGTSATLDAGRDINLLAAEETDHYEEHSRSEGSFGRSKSHDLVHDESRLRGTTITVGNADDPEAVPGQLTLTAGNDILLYASQAMATGQADVDAGGNLSLIAGINTVSHREQSSKESAATYRNNDQGYIVQTAAASAISAGGDLNLNAGKDIRLTASLLHTDQIFRIGDEEVDPADLNAASPKRPMNVMVDTLALTNESWNETEKGFKGPIKELVKGLSFVAMMMMPVAALTADELPEVTVSEHDRVRSRDTVQAASGLYAQELDLRTHGTAAFVAADINVSGTAAIRAENIILDAVAETSHYAHEYGSDTIKALGVNLDKDKGELRVAGVQTTKTGVSDTQDTTRWRGTSLNAGNLILEAEKNIDILGSQLTVVNDAIVKAGEDLTIAGKEGNVASEHREATETISVGLAVRNAYVDAVLAVKGLAAATDALKEAKRALEDATARADRGELDQDDVAYFHANLAAATANLAQAQIAAAGAVGAMATTGGTGGFYASASAQREQTVSSTRSEQTVWQGSTITVGGNAALIAGDTLTVKGSDITVDKHAVAGADTSAVNSNLLVVNAREINLLAGAERSTQSSKTRTDSQGGSVSFSGGAVTGGGLSGGYQEGDTEATSLRHINSHLRAGTLSSNSEALRLRGAVVEADHIDIATQRLSIVSLQDEDHSRGVSKGLSVGVGFGNTAEADAPKQLGRTSNSISANYQKSESERRWVDEQSGIIGHDSIRIRANDTTLVGGLIANATRDDNGALVDRGNLDMQTETLTVQHLHDVDRSRTVGGSLGVSVSSVPASQAKGTESNGPSPAQGKDKTPVPVPHNALTAGATYLGHDKVQATHGTLGLGHIVVGGTTLTDDNAVHPGLGDLNRDLNLAQEITKDNDVGGLNFVTTVDLRWFSPEGREDMLKEQKAAAGGMVLAGMDLLTVGKVAGKVITNEVVLVDAGKALAGTLDQLHGVNTYVMGNAAGAAQIEAHANGESGDLTATQAATNALTQSVNGESTRLVSIGTIAGAHDSLTGTNYINAGLTDSYMTTVGHEMAHSYTRSESIADYMGWATDVIWSTGVWANSAAISAYKPAAINLASLHEQNSRLLQDNNANLTTSLLSHAESFNYSLLGDDARALFQVGVNWAASKVDKPWAKGMVKGVGGLVDGGMALADAVLDTAGSAMHCPFGNADACNAAMDANRKRGEAGIQFGKYIVSGKAGADLADTIWNLNHGTPEQVAKAQEAIVKFSTELGLGAVVAKVGVASKGGAATTTSTKAAAPAIAKSEAASPSPTTLPADGEKSVSTPKASDVIGQSVDQGSPPTPEVASDFTALLDDYPYQPGWTSFEDYMLKGNDVLNEPLFSTPSAVTNSTRLNVLEGSGSSIRLDGHKIYDPAYPPLSTNPSAQYRFSDPTFRATGGDVYFGENLATAYFEVQKNVGGKSLFVGDLRMENMLDLTDASVVKRMNIDQSRLMARVNSPVDQKAVYGYTNQISNEAFAAGYNGIIYKSTRGPGNAVVLFGGRYDPKMIVPVIDVTLP